MAGTATMCTSTTRPTTWRTAPTAGATTTCVLCSRLASGTCAGRGTSSLPRFCARAVFGMSCTCGATTAITTGRGGGRWRGRTWSRGKTNCCFRLILYWKRLGLDNLRDVDDALAVLLPNPLGGMVKHGSFCVVWISDVWSDLDASAFVLRCAP